MSENKKRNYLRLNFDSTQMTSVEAAEIFLTAMNNFPDYVDKKHESEDVLMMPDSIVEYKVNKNGSESCWIEKHDNSVYFVTKENNETMKQRCRK